MFFVSFSLVGMESGNEDVDFGSVIVKTYKRKKIKKVNKDDGFSVTIKQSFHTGKLSSLKINGCSSFKGINELQTNDIEKISRLFVCNSQLRTFDNSSIEELLPSIGVFKLSKNKCSFDFKSLSIFPKLVKLEVDLINLNESFFCYLKNRENETYLSMKGSNLNSNFFKELSSCLCYVDYLELNINVEPLSSWFMPLTFVKSLENNFYKQQKKECYIKIKDCCDICIRPNPEAESYFIDKRNLWVKERRDFNYIFKSFFVEKTE